ncbi:MAG: DUF3352 domain-containing protein [Calothrix sp. C42_A2020_038]|nr:DUF3352 domain-containing protein [Calothrix sp. C42_A2020_038]
MTTSSFVRLFTASLVMLLICFANCAEAWASNPLGKGSENITPGAAIFVSKQAPAMVSILDAERLNLLQNKDEYSFLRTDFLRNLGIDYRKDLQAWLGNELTLAVTNLDFDHDPDNGKLPGYLLAISTKSPEKSREFVQLFFSKRVLAGADLNVEEYAGIKIISETPRDKGTLAGAVVGDKYVLFANDPKVLREAINNVQAPDLNLYSVSQYQNLNQDVKQTSKNSLAVVFLNLPIVAEWLQLKLPIQTFTTQLITLAPVSKGLLAEIVALSTEETKAPLESLSKPVSALRYLPANAGIVVGSKNLSNLENTNLSMYWQQLKSVLSTQGGINITDFVQKDAEPQKHWDVNLSKDIFDWVEGEYAIGLISNPQKLNPDWIFVTETAPQTQEDIAKLDAIVAKNGLNVTSFTLESHPITAWTQLKAAEYKSSGKDKPSFNIEAKAYGLHTTLDNYEIFTSSLEIMHEILTTKGNTLLENPNFQKIAVLPQPNSGYLYINWAASQKILERQLPILKLLKVVAKSFFSNLRSLTITNYGSESNLLKGDVFFQLEE